MGIMEDEQKKEQIRAAVSELPDEVVRDALVLSLLSGPVQTASAEERNLETEGFQDIFELVAYLKRTYSFPELNHLVIEGGKLFFKDGDRRIVMGEQNYQNPNQPDLSVRRPPTARKDGGNQTPPPANESHRFSQLELDD